MNPRRSTFRRSLIALGGAPLLTLGALASAGIAQVAADHSALAVFEQANPGNREAIEYKVVDQVLESFVIPTSNSTEVRYDAIKGDGERILTQLVSGFASVDPRELNTDEQLAYWLNLRALLVLNSAGQAFPSAKPDQLLAPGSAFATTKVVTVAGVALSIGDIDAILLKRAAANPNIVYGLVLPVREAPAFPRKAFRGATLNAALDEAARAFINRSGAVKIDADTAKVPQFLIGHRERLGSDDAALLTHIRGLAVPKLEQKLMTATRLSADPRLSLNAFAQRSFADRGFGGTGGGGGRAAGS